MPRDDAVRRASTRRAFAKYGGTVSRRLTRRLHRRRRRRFVRLRFARRRHDRHRFDRRRPGGVTDRGRRRCELHGVDLADGRGDLRVAAGDGVHAAHPSRGHGVRAGPGNDVTALHAPDYYDGLWNQYVERACRASALDWSGLYSSWQPDKEKLYELDSDIHLADPAWVTQVEGWERSDIDEIAENVSPWFGNSLSDRHQEPAEEWADGYQYYGGWEQFEIVAEAFRERASATKRSQRSARNSCRRSRTTCRRRRSARPRS